jgi:hypothetical protein
MSLEYVTDVFLTDVRLANPFPGGIFCDRQCIGSGTYVPPKL